MDETHTTLEVMLAPNDNNDCQVCSIWKMTLQFGDRIQVEFIRGHDVLHALKSTIM